MVASTPVMGESLNSEDGVSLLQASARPHYASICSTPKLVPFLALRERNSEHRYRQPRGWSHLISKCGARACSKSQIRHRLRHRFRGREE